MSSITPINVPSTAPSFPSQGSHQSIANPLGLSRRVNTGSYYLSDLFGQPLDSSLGTFQRHPELTPQERQYILHANNRGAINALSKRQFICSSTSQSPGGFLSVFPNDGGVELSSVPLSRTESCPLPGPAFEKSQVMRRQHSSVDPSAVPEHLLGHLLTGATSSQYTQPIQIQQDASTANQTMCLVPANSSFPPQGLPIQHISAPAIGSSYGTTIIPSGLVGYLSQNFRDDPFSSVRGSACPQTSQQKTVENLSIHGISFNGLGTGLPAHYSHSPLTIPYTIDMNSAAFTAPRMEPQLSSSTFFDSTSTNPDLESGDEFMISEMDMGRETNEDLQAQLARLADMSASQLTVRDNQIVHMLSPRLPSFHNTSGLDFTAQTTLSSSEQPLTADLQLLPELTDTVGTPSSPAQMSRQPSCAANYTNNFGNFGPHSQASGAIDVLTAPEMGREWSDLSNPAIFTFNTGGPLSSDGQRQLKRMRQGPPEDIELLLTGAGIDTCVGATDAYSQYVDVPSVGTWQGLDTQLPNAPIQVPASENLDCDFGAEFIGLDEGAYNPTKLRRIDGHGPQDVQDARAHAKNDEVVALQRVKSLSNFPSCNFVPTTRPLPAFDQHLAMRKSESKAISNTAQPVVGNTQQVVRATTTTVTTSTVIDTVQNVSRAVPQSTLGSHRSGATSSSIGMSSQLSSRQYVRRTHPRVYCNQCNEVRDGFRGDHELRRHKERVHAVNKKVWVTKDISPDGDFLSGCKACKRGKHYFADYNAAAHLRRQHFCKEGKRGKSKKERDEKRKYNVEKVHNKLENWGIEWREESRDGGRGGANRTGEEFSLKFLRRWMRQIEIPRKASDPKITIDSPLSGDEDDDNYDAKEKDLEITDKDNDKDLSSRPIVFTDVKLNGGVSEKSSTESSTCSEPVQPEIQPYQSPFQQPLTYGELDITRPAEIPASCLQLEMHRELQALLEPAMDRVDISLESFRRLQDGLG